jgi:hypothetical protein
VTAVQASGLGKRYRRRWGLREATLAYMSRARAAGDAPPGTPSGRELGVAG